MVSFEANVAVLAEDLNRFCDGVCADALDGYVTELPGQSYGGTIDQLADSVCALLTALSARDPQQAGSMCVAIDEPAWRFRFAGRVLFVLVFAPCYPIDNPRHTNSVDSIFVLFQPDEAFTRRLRPGEQVIGEDVRNQIRVAHAIRGLRYDLAITRSACEAHKFVKPLRFGDPVVRWWDRRGGQSSGAG